MSEFPMSRVRPSPIGGHRLQRFASSFHAQRQARKNRFSFEEGDFVKFSIRFLT